VRIFLILALFGSLLLGGCGGGFSPEEEEIRGLLNRYGNALLLGEYELAKSCLVPGGPREQNFDLTFRIVQNILTTEPQYTQEVCSIPLFGVALERVVWQGDWVRVELKSRQVCGFCESSWPIPFPVPAAEYVYPSAPSPSSGVSPFHRWVCFENFFLIDTDVVWVRKEEDRWLLY